MPAILWWIIVGLIAGLLASFVMGGVGAFIGGWLFSAMGWGTPFGGIAGTIFVAFIGAVLLLLILRLIRGSTRRA